MMTDPSASPPTACATITVVALGLYAGTLDFARAPLGGLRVVLTLPAAGGLW